MKSAWRGLLAVAIVAMATRGWAGPKWDFNEGDSWMKLSFLGQVHGQYLEDAADQEDFYLRRARIIVAGQITDGVQFFAETDNDNAGKNGAADSSTDIQDAFADIRILDSDHWVEAGLVLLPFSFENKSSAASLLGLDYNSEAIKFVNTFVWRDYGAELHGYFLDKRLAYRVGVFDGYDSSGGNKNADADLRYTGHIAVNVVGEAETGWFFSQSRLAREGAYLSVGAGADMQDKATLVGDEAPAAVDSDAWVVDFQSGFDVGASAVTVNGAWYEWDNSSFDGSTAFVESGVAVRKAMVTGKYSEQKPDMGAETRDYTVGLHYFLNGQNARGGLEYRWGDSPDMVLGGIQFLL